MGERSGIGLLLVDDEAELLDSLSRGLSRRGFVVRAALGASEALELMDEAPAEVAVLDVKMPGLDGVGLFRVIKRRWPETAVIILTGHASVEQAFRTSKEGVYDYLAKPCDVDALAAVATRAAAERASGSARREAQDPPGPVRLLLVDDDPDFLDSHAKLLRRRGIEVYAAPDGPTGLSALNDAPFDVAVLDIAMPGLDGIEVLHAIKRDHPSVEVLLLTGQPSIRVALRGIKEGAFDFISKPTDIDSLVERIRAAHRHGREAAAAASEEELERIVRGAPD